MKYIILFFDNFFVQKSMFFKNSIFWLKQKVFFSKDYILYKNSISNESLSSDDIDQINWEKRIKIIAFVYKNIPFYKEFYDTNGFHPNDLKTFDDWAKVPILEKEYIRERKDDILNPRISRKKLINVTTGGSTGKPLNSFRDKTFPESILKWRMLKRWGVSPASDMLMLWRIPIKSNSIINKLINELIWWPTKRYKFDASSLNEEKLTKIVKIIKNKKPKIIWGYVGAIEQLALYCKDKNIRLTYNPLVWVTAAPLSKIQKQLINSTLSIRILDQYACSELHWVAHSIPGFDNLVVENDFRHVDVVDKQANLLTYDVEGDLLLTDLENFAFPLVKYRVGDRAKKCLKYKDLPHMCISPVKGRVTDQLSLPNGMVLSGEYLTTIFDEYFNYVSQFQIIYRKDETILIRIVPNMDISEELDTIVLKVINDISKKIEQGVKIKYQFVDFIESDAGKIRYIKKEI